jgi:hypothetical protein
VIRSIETEVTARSVSGRTGTQDGYLERVLKLIPAETVAVYLFLQGVLQSALDGSNEIGQLQAWLWGIFFVLLVGNILYIRRYLDVTDTAQYLIMTLAYVVWVFTIGGPFQYLSFYQPFIGSVVLGLFTFFVPLLYKGVLPT